MYDSELYKRLIARIKIDEASGCWVWLGPAWNRRKSPGNRYGYTQVRIVPGKWKTLGTHKAMWLAKHGPPAKGMCVCHECDNPLCLNPDHLWLGTHLQNMADCRAKNRYHYAKLTHCKRGHEFNEQNTYIIKTPGKAFGLRSCKACHLGRLRVKAGWPEDLAYSLPPGNLGETWQQQAARLGLQVPQCAEQQK